MTPADYALAKAAILHLRATGWALVRRGYNRWDVNLILRGSQREYGRMWIIERGRITMSVCPTSLAQAVDYLATAGTLPIELHSAYRAALDSMPWQHCVTDGVDIRLFDSCEQAAAWAAPTGEGHPRLSVRRQRRGPWEVAA
jgi:hypothetical protein